MNLVNIYNEKKFITDKYDLGYLDNIYDDLFKKYLGKPISFLEIGIQRGGSLQLWEEYFDKSSQIYGMDILFCKNIENQQKIKQFTCNAYTEESANIFKSSTIDIIVDDGPHTLESFILLIDLYFDKLKTDGLLVIEDIINISWTPILVNYAKQKGYKEHNVYNMAGKQKTEQLLRLWSNGLDVLVLTK